MRQKHKPRRQQQQGSYAGKPFVAYVVRNGGLGLCACKCHEQAQYQMDDWTNLAYVDALLAQGKTTDEAGNMAFQKAIRHQYVAKSEPYFTLNMCGSHVFQMLDAFIGKSGVSQLWLTIISIFPNKTIMAVDRNEKLHDVYPTLALYENGDVHQFLAAYKEKSNHLTIGIS